MAGRADSDSLPYMEFAVLAAGGLLLYVIPSFPVYDAVLREVRLQWMAADYGKLPAMPYKKPKCSI